MALLGGMSKDERMRIQKRDKESTQTSLRPLIGTSLAGRPCA
jgi:hypothetical protein